LLTYVTTVLRCKSLALGNGVKGDSTVMYCHLLRYIMEEKREKLHYVSHV